MNETYKKFIEGLNEIELNDFLDRARAEYLKSIRKAEEYFKIEMGKGLKEIMLSSEYWALTYNSDKANFILIKLDLQEEDKKILETFVYWHNDFLREFGKIEEVENIKKKGFIEINIQDKNLAGKKVKGFFKVSKLGLLGSYDAFDLIEGRLLWAERFNQLVLIPKGNRTRGLVIRRGFIE